jgi:hypothetical protein
MNINEQKLQPSVGLDFDWGEARICNILVLFPCKCNINQWYMGSRLHSWSLSRFEVSFFTKEANVIKSYIMIENPTSMFKYLLHCIMQSI